MEIEDNILSISNCIFKDKEKYIYITDTQKEKYFFVLNRYFAKKYPQMAQLLNHKNIDKVSAFDLWYYFFLDKPYPKWFWSKSEKAEKSDISEKDYKLLMFGLKLKDIDLDYLIENHIDFVKDELKFLKDIEKNK